jgi:hypothetical protein
MVQPAAKNITATRPKTDRLKKTKQPFPENILLDDFDNMIKTSQRCFGFLLFGMLKSIDELLNK